MDIHAPWHLAPYIAGGAALLFVFDLILDWQKATVEIAGVVDLESATSGWSGWGVAAGLLAIAVIVLAITRLAIGTAVAAAGMLVATVLTAFTGDADLVPPRVRAEVDTTLWPTWIGLGLAGVTLLAALTPFVETLAGRRPSGVVADGT
jgi:hypothetical protein